MPVLYCCSENDVLCSVPVAMEVGHVFIQSNVALGCLYCCMWNS